MHDGSDTSHLENLTDHSDTMAKEDAEPSPIAELIRDKGFCIIVSAICGIAMTLFVVNAVG